MANPFDDLMPEASKSRSTPAANFGGFADLVPETEEEKQLSPEVPTPRRLQRERAAQEQRQAEQEAFRKSEAEYGPIPGARALTRERLTRMFTPSAEATATTAAALRAAPYGPYAMLGAGGLAYMTTREASRKAAGEKGVTPLGTLATDFASGAAFEGLGQLLGPAIKKGAELTARGVGKVLDIGQLGKLRASRIAKQAAGSKITKIRETLRQAINEDISAGQALARTDPQTGEAVLNLPTLQALLDRVSKRDPEFFSSMFNRQELARIKQLEDMAGAGNQTAARELQDEMKKAVNDRLIPVLKQELDAANIAGQVGPKLEAEAAKMGEGAAQKVADVRRFTAAGERARAADVTPVPGQPRVSTQITYEGELAKRADDVAAQAAEGSLIFGEARRFAEAGLQSLAAYNLKPLKAESVIAAINRKLSDPKLAGTEAEPALRNLIEDIRQWTNAGGIIDAWALDSLRKNSVNRYINATSANPKQARALASQVMASVKPAMVEAIEQAGGTGYGKYLDDYMNAMQYLNQVKFGGELLGKYKSSPADFVKIVEGNNPKLVEKIFGPGSYNMFKELSANIQKRLGDVAQEVQRDKEMQKQVTAGQEKLTELMKEHFVTLNLPNWLNAMVTTTNRFLDILGRRVGADAINTLTEAAKSAQSFDELLAMLPAYERNAFLQAMSDPTLYRSFGGVIAASASDVQRSNQQRQPSPRMLRQSRYGGVTNVNPFMEK